MRTSPPRGSGISRCGTTSCILPRIATVLPSSLSERVVSYRIRLKRRRPRPNEASWIRRSLRTRCLARAVFRSGHGAPAAVPGRLADSVLRSGPLRSDGARPIQSRHDDASHDCVLVAGRGPFAHDLPSGRAQSIAPSCRCRLAEPPSRMSPTLLYIDDDQRWADEVGPTLRQAGFDVTHARDPGEALRSARERPPS